MSRQAPVIFDTADSPACTECGSITVRNGSCLQVHQLRLDERLQLTPCAAPDLGRFLA